MEEKEMISNLIEEAIKGHLELCMDDYLGEPMSPSTNDRIKKDALAAIFSVVPVEHLDIDVRVESLVNGTIHVDISYKEENNIMREPVEDNLNWFVNSM